jgi:hypothetical protein
MAFNELELTSEGDILKDFPDQVSLPILNVQPHSVGIDTKPSYSDKFIQAYSNALKKSVSKLDNIEFDLADYDCQRALDLDIYASELKKSGFEFTGSEKYNSLTVKFAILDTCKMIPDLKKLLDMNTKSPGQLLTYIQNDEAAMLMYISNLSNPKMIDIAPFLKNMPQV